MTQRRSTETRHKILNTAQELFSSRGYENTSVSAICESASLSKGAFYHHFASKHDVFSAILDDWLRGLDQEFLTSLKTTGSVPDGILAMTGSFSRVINESRSSLPLFLEFWLHSVRDPVTWEKTTEPYFSYVRYFKQLLDRGVQEGSLQNMDTGQTSYALISLAIGYLLQNMMNPTDHDWSKLSEESFSQFINGMRRRES